MTKEERAEKLIIVEVIEDRIRELQELIADREDSGVRDETFFKLLLDLEQWSEMLVKWN